MKVAIRGMVGKYLFLILVVSLISEAKPNNPSEIRKSFRQNIRKLQTTFAFSRSKEISFHRRGVFQITNKPNSIELIFFRDVESDETEENLRMMKLPSPDGTNRITVHETRNSRQNTTGTCQLQMVPPEEQERKEDFSSQLIEEKKRGSYYITFYNSSNGDNKKNNVLLSLSVPNDLNNLTDTEQKIEHLETEDSQILCLWRLWEDYSKYHGVCDRYLVFSRQKPLSKDILYIKKGKNKKPDMAFFNGIRLFITGSNPLIVISDFLLIKLGENENPKEAEESIKKEEAEDWKFSLALRIMKYRIKNIVQIKMIPNDTE